MVSRAAAAGEILKAALSPVLTVPLVAASVLFQARFRLKSLKVARPVASVVRASVQLRVPLPLDNPIVTATPERGLPKLSRTRTVTAGLMIEPAVALAGCCTKLRLPGAPGFTVKKTLVALLNPLALAVSCLLVPTESMRRSVKATEPFPAAVPMSRVVVPWRVPVPLVRATVTLRFEGKPVAELFPNASRDLSEGCAPNDPPAVALPGWAVKTRWLAAAGPTLMGLEVTLVKLPLEKVIVMLVATLCDRLV